MSKRKMSKSSNRQEFTPMASFGNRIQAQVAAAFLLVILRSVDGGKMITVGDTYGWRYNSSSPSGSAFDYQGWISQQTLSDTDALDFGQFRTAFLVSVEAAEACNMSQGTFIPIEPGYGQVYNLSDPSSQNLSGHLGFINPMYCANGLKFTVNITLNIPDFDPVNVPNNAPVTTNDPANGPDNASESNHHHKVAWTVGIVVGSVAILAVLVVLILVVAFLKRTSYWHKLRKSSDRHRIVLSYMSSSRSHSHSHWSHTNYFESSLSQPHSSHTAKDFDSSVEMEWPWAPQRFSYKELKSATDSFNSALMIGEGGFGTVYKGYLRDSPGAPVAVKRLSQYARQGAREFMAEVNIISQLRHRNLVQLLGWCDEDDELILVYEYMPNGDVDDLIFSNDLGTVDGEKPSPLLSWKHRYNIFCGVAAALIYLHEEWEQRVVHRDVKTSNVMLDSEFNARLGDFGLARLSAHSQAPRTTMVAGTIGYLAPEFSLTGRATDKTDVYAFGVVVLEVSCARRPLTVNCILVDWVWELHKKEKLLEAIDPKLEIMRNPDDEVEMKLALKVGLLCCHPDPGGRPSMRDVLNILTGKTPLPKMPRSKPVAVFEEDMS
ncbi:unnamed protein product [Calypogeia fissa]